jgi:hypothetical protein
LDKHSEVQVECLVHAQRAVGREEGAFLCSLWVYVAMVAGAHVW